MVDAILHCIEACEPADVTLWTWRIADYEVDVFRQLAAEGKIASGTLVIDQSARPRRGASPDEINRSMIALWRSRFGPTSVRYVSNHSKIALVEGGGLRLLLRGSMNLNFNPRFEQLDVTEGGEDFDLMKQVTSELEVLPDHCTNDDVTRSSKLSAAYDKRTLDMFSGLRRWAK